MELTLVGIGTGNPDHLTLQAVEAIRAADLLLIPEKGEDRRELADLRRQVAMGGGAGPAGGGEKEVAGIKFAARVLDGMPAKDLKPMADEMKKQVGSGASGLVGCEIDGAPAAVAAVNADHEELSHGFGPPAGCSFPDFPGATTAEELCSNEL